MGSIAKNLENGVAIECQNVGNDKAARLTLLCCPRCFHPEKTRQDHQATTDNGSRRAKRHPVGPFSRASLTIPGLFFNWMA
jgi:hypothetical protein